ncbi:Asp/Glu racemase [Roseobacter denitrificans]|uniref:Asp/Glu/Hydantoin racemase family protein, putative n=1 Tax=Roseobacter denitrificans (strain ATCC 33942 / OCh 114) TaxID=375451 RepID=Q162Y7_ROSDO|nr:aspartate/glutamate racemase family protein [Roseobacter denitrificans]ABG32956.1 Asp/Glu/Hydantoin racemase family protein, putative [Roseobacter denitrificans OCh 114]AVL52345.1 Asp/Glu racemase [Roseobacter denitrificans]SFG10523.1 maleate isomerase [Roseobacter denitrificans OCh 114]
MSPHRFSYTLSEPVGARLGLIVLQSDETIEGDMRRLLPFDAQFMVSRVPSDSEVTCDTLALMEQYLSAAAALFPQGLQFDVMGYGCTSGTAQIGVEKVAARLRDSLETRAVTQPLSSLLAACEYLGLKRLALLSPYVAAVSDTLRAALRENGITTDVVGSFDVGTEADVVRIDPAAVQGAAITLMENADVDGLFLSCTNLRTLDVIDPLETRLGLPVLSSNQVLAWHMMRLAGLRAPPHAPGQLFAQMRASDALQQHQPDPDGQD